MAIPIQNIYYLLCYAWNKLDEKEKVQVDIENSTQLLDFVCKSAHKWKQAFAKKRN